MANINLNKEVYNKSQFKRVVNTNFTQLVDTTPQVTSSITDNLDPNVIEARIIAFFDSYNSLFYDIPKFGDTNSHEYLIKTSSEYIGTSTFPNDTVEALIEEVNSLREENLTLQQQIISGSL